MPLKSLLITLLFFFFSEMVCAQKFIAVDNYGRNRRKIYAGDQIVFKMKGTEAVYHDEVHAVLDSSFILLKSMTQIPIKEIEVIKFHRPFPKLIAGGTALIGAGFLLSGATSRDSENHYAKDVALLQSGAFFLISAATIPFWWKRYRIGKNAQVQVLDVTIQKTTN
ncbi:hypothetical protein [Flammeovirga sp. SubArs3]|uniref:hypothetical protein n=1 Tax=Flammeovirga sp. SubArs3 TaxID=2995316 RepID=UPI00248B000E|nr:hypothetical protein [Flammeovirga sp. SubArs3]